MRALLRSVLRGNGFRTLEAGNLKDGLEFATSALPQLIVVDLGLPDGHGTELVRRVREWSSIPIFVLSACDRSQDKVAGLNAGADDYVTKPFTPEELVARVRAARHDPAHRYGERAPDLPHAHRISLACRARAPSRQRRDP